MAKRKKKVRRARGTGSVLTLKDGRIVARWVEEGKRKQRAGFDTEDQAHEWLDGHVAKQQEARDKFDAEGLVAKGLAESMDEYNVYLRDVCEKKPATLTNVANALNMFLAFVTRNGGTGVPLQRGPKGRYQKTPFPLIDEGHEVVYVHEITFLHTKRFLRAMESIKLMASTRLERVTVIRCWLSWCQGKRDYFPASVPMAALFPKGAMPTRKEDANRRKPVPQRVPVAMWREFTEAATDDWRDHLTFILLTGCRVGELLDLTWERVDLDDGWIQLQGKTKNARRFIPLLPPVMDIMRRWKLRTGGEGRVVYWPTEGTRKDCRPNRQQIILQVKRAAAQVEGKALAAMLRDHVVKTHMLRHWFVNAALRAGLSVTALQLWVGHVVRLGSTDAYQAPDEWGWQDEARERMWAVIGPHWNPPGPTAPEATGRKSLPGSATSATA